MNFQEIRQKYPEYSDMSDADFASKFHQKFYSDMSFDDFSSKVGYAKEQPKTATTQKAGLFDNFSVDKALEAAKRIPKQMLGDVVGANEAAANIATGATTGTVAGTIGGLQGILDSARNGTFGTKKGLESSANKFMDQMELATYQPRTKRGQEMASAVGDVIATHGPSLMSIAPQLEMLGALQKTRSSMPRTEPVKAPSADAAALAELRSKAAEVAPQEARVKVNEWDKQQTPYGVQGDLFEQDPLAAAREQAKAESEGIIRDANGPQGDLFAGAAERSAMDSGSLERLLAERRNAEPIPYEKVSEPYAPETSFGEAPQVQEGLPFIEDTRSEPIQHAESVNNAIDLWNEPEVPTASRDYAKAQDIEQAYLEKAKQDALVQEEPIAEPSQGSTLLEKFSNDRTTNLPSPNDTLLGQTRFGRGQRGSIGFFGKDPYEKFAENLRREVPDVTDAELKQLWENKQKQTQPALEKQTNIVNQNKAFQKATGLDPKYTGEVWEHEKAIEVFSTVPDMDSRSLLKEQVSSSGRLQRDLFNNPVTTWVYNLTNKAVENGRLMARKVLDDNGIGVVPMIRKHVMYGKGQMEMREYLAWRFANEGGSIELPSKFSDSVRKIHETLNKADEQLLAKMNEVLAKDGKAPIQKIDNHMVHYWSGPYRSYIYVKTPNGGSRLAFFVSENSHGDAMKALNWIKENVPNVDLEKSTGVSFVKSAVRNRSTMFDHLLDLSNEKDPTVREALEAFKERVQGMQERHLGEQHRQEYRAGVQGFLGNKPWLSKSRNYADAMESIRTKYDAGYQWVAAQEIRQQMEPVLQAQQDGKISVGNALAMGQKYVDHALGKNMDVALFTRMADYLEEISPTKFGPARRGVGHVQQFFSKVTIPWLLALKGTQAAQSILQVGQATIPRMLEMRTVYGGDYHHIATSLAHGSMDGLFQLANTVTNGRYEHLSRTLMEKVGIESSEVTNAIHQFIKDNDIASMSLSDTGYSREGGFFKSYGNRTAEMVLNAPMNLFEGPTRTWAFSAYVRQAVKDGYDIHTALQLGKEAMDTMVNYNPEAGSMGLSNLGVAGREARGLHTFMVNYYTQLARYSKLAVESGGKQAGPLASYLAITFALGGAIGFIGTDLADWLIDDIKAAARGSDWDSPALQKFSLRKWLLENANDNISVGPLSAQTGLGLYGSFTTKVVDPDRTLLDNMFPKTMASLQIAKGILQTPQLLQDDLTDKERGTIIENVAPKYLTQSIRNRFQNKDNVVYDPNADRVGLPQYERTDKEQQISRYGLGVRGLSEVLAGEDMRNYYKGQKNINESQKKQQAKLDSDFVAMWKYGLDVDGNSKAPQFIRDRVANQYKNLLTTWQIPEDELGKHIERLASDYGIPQDAVRKLVAIKNPNLKDVDKIRDLGGIIQRQQKRKELYGR